MYFDPYGTLWGLCFQDGNLIVRSESRDVLIEEKVTKDEAVSLAQLIERPPIAWVRIPIS